MRNEIPQFQHSITFMQNKTQTDDDILTLWIQPEEEEGKKLNRRIHSLYYFRRKTEKIYMPQTKICQMQLLKFP